MKVGDYVRLKNGYIDKIEELKLQTKYTKYNKLLFERKVVECLFSDEDLKEIKSIVTHEQFESIQYNLESEVN